MGDTRSICHARTVAPVALVKDDSLDGIARIIMAVAAAVVAALYFGNIRGEAAFIAFGVCLVALALGALSKEK